MPVTARPAAPPLAGDTGQATDRAPVPGAPAIELAVAFEAAYRSAYLEIGDGPSDDIDGLAEFAFQSELHRAVEPFLGWRLGLDTPRSALARVDMADRALPAGADRGSLVEAAVVEAASAEIVGAVGLATTAARRMKTRYAACP